MDGLHARMRRALGYGGRRVVASGIVRRCLRPVARWQTLVLAVRDLSGLIPPIEPSIPVEIRFLSDTEVWGFRAAFERQGLGWSRIEKRLRRGDRCAAALAGDQLLYTSWLTFTMAWIPEVEAAILLEPNEVYGFNAVTLSEARGKNLHPAVIAFIMREAQAFGCRRHLSYVRADNFSGLRSTAKIERDRCLYVRRVEVLGLRGALITGLDAPGCSRFGFAASTATRRLGALGVWVTGSADEDALDTETLIAALDR